MSSVVNVHQPSDLLKNFLRSVDNAEKVYALLYQSFALLVNHIGQNPQYTLRFTRLGEVGTEYRPPMGSNEFRSLVPLVLSTTIATPLCFVASALDSYLYEIGKFVYTHQGNGIPLKADDTWYRPDMIKVITDVDPRECVNFPAAEKIQSLMDQVRYPWAQSENVPFDVFEKLLRDIRVFATDYEIAIQMRWPRLRLDGAE